MNRRERYYVPGFTFTEMMIVVLIMGILAAVITPAYWAFVGRAQQRTTEQMLQQLKHTINMFKIEQGRYPTKLQELVERPKGEAGKDWRQYYEKIPKDGWKQEFYYKVTPKGKHPYELYSYGPSGPEEEGDRINVWDL